MLLGSKLSLLIRVRFRRTYCVLRRIEFYANKRYHMGKALKVDAVGPVTFFAEGGQATVEKAEVSGLKGK